VEEQWKASEAITPGHLIQFNSSQWRKHADAAKNAQPTFALERDEMGKDIDTAYAANDYVKAGFFHTGDKVNALIASGQDLNPGDALESAGDGTLRALATDAATDDTQRTSVVAYSAEVSGAVTVLTRHRVVVA